MKSSLKIAGLVLAVFLVASQASAQRRGFGDTRSSSSPPGGSSAPAAPRNGGAGGTSSTSSSTGSSSDYAPPPTIAPAPPPPPAVVVPVYVDAPITLPLADAWADDANVSNEDDAVVLWDFHTAPTDAAFDFSEAGRRPSNDPAADIVFEVRDGEGYMDVAHDTDIRDLGSTDDSAERPAKAEWSPIHEVLLTPGHAYLVWTWDDQFFKFAVTAESGQRVRFVWTQVDEDTHYRTPGLTRNGSTRPVFVRTKFPQ